MGEGTYGEVYKAQPPPELASLGKWRTDNESPNPIAEGFRSDNLVTSSFSSVLMNMESNYLGFNNRRNREVNFFFELGIKLTYSPPRAPIKTVRPNIRLSSTEVMAYLPSTHGSWAEWDTADSDVPKSSDQALGSIRNTIIQNWYLTDLNIFFIFLKAIQSCWRWRKSGSRTKKRDSPSRLWERLKYCASSSTRTSSSSGWVLLSANCSYSSVKNWKF